MIGDPDRDGWSVRLRYWSYRKLASEVALSLAIYGLITWIYVAICALTEPDTLKLPLTHLLPHLREDTSGAIGFALSFLGFVTYRLSRKR